MDKYSQWMKFHTNFFTVYAYLHRLAASRRRSCPNDGQIVHQSGAQKLFLYIHASLECLVTGV